MRLTPDGLESTKWIGGGIRCVDNCYRDRRGPSRQTPSGSWNLSRKTLEISQLGPFPRRLSVLRSIDSIHDSRRALALINLTFRFLFSSKTTCYTLHQFVPSPTIDVLRIQRRRSNRYRLRRHRTTPRRVPPERASSSDHAFSESPSSPRSPSIPHPTRSRPSNTFTLLGPGVIWVKFGPRYGPRMEWRWVRLVGWLDSSNSRLWP